MRWAVLCKHCGCRWPNVLAVSSNIKSFQCKIPHNIYKMWSRDHVTSFIMGAHTPSAVKKHGSMITSFKWKHFPRNWPFVRGIHRSPLNSPHKGQWRGALMFSLICVWINDWVNNREAGDLRRHRVHYDVIVMQLISFNVYVLCCYWWLRHHDMGIINVQCAKNVFSWQDLNIPELHRTNPTGPLLLTWINFNPGMDKWFHPS